MSEHRRYDAKTKLSVVLASDMVGVTAAADAAGINESTVRYWLDDPQFAPFRAKAREDLAEEIKVVAHLAWKRVGETIGRMDPRDALFAAEKSTTLTLLMSGDATSRIESVNLTDDIPDDTKRELRARLARSVRGESELAGEASVPVGVGSAVDS